MIDTGLNGKNGNRDRCQSWDWCCYSHRLCPGRGQGLNYLFTTITGAVWRNPGECGERNDPGEGILLP